VSLDALVGPAHTAVLVSEMQRGIVGEESPMRELVDAARAGPIEACTRLVTGARAAGVRVLHATLAFRSDRAGTTTNTPLLAAMLRDRSYLTMGTPAAAIIGELAPTASDIVVERLHGVSAFTGTELDPILRNLGIQTIVPCGVSLNEAIMGMAIQGADLGYSIALPHDATIAIPASFKADLLTHAYAMLASVVAVDDILAIWGKPTTDSTAAR
jgi:nicotinamidase-related amidase